MEIEFQLSKKDLTKAANLYIIDALQKRLWMFILLTVLCIFPASGNSKEWWRILLAIVSAPILPIIVLYFIPSLIGSIRLNGYLKTNKSALEKKRLVTNDEGMLIESVSKSQTQLWESFVSAYSNQKFIYLICADKTYLPLPKIAFLSDASAGNFLGLVQSKIIKARGFLIPSNGYNNSKPSYFIGMLCLVLLIGAIAGIVFIINGLVKYKDKIFVLIGIGGILFTVAVYSALFYSTTTPGFNKMMAEASQRQLNSLMKDVEFYKIKNGAYPDSLAQISNDNSNTWIYDPLSPGEQSKEYNYKRAGNHYYLFSSGIDGIPNTPDDFYPQIAEKDSIKFGLIRKTYH